MIHEECGVFGIWSAARQNLAVWTKAGLYALQHRGQEGCGMAVNDDRHICVRKGLGLVSEVFPDGGAWARESDQIMVPAPDGEEEGGIPTALWPFSPMGTIAIGHVRYATSGAGTPENAQPLLVRHVKGQLALCHNGNLTNAKRLRRQLELAGCIFHTTSDTEVISYLITRHRLRESSIERAVFAAMEELEGAYSLVLMSPAKLLACRDPQGFRPLCCGRCPDGSIVFASETCALDAVGEVFLRDIEPGELVVVENGTLRSLGRLHPGTRPSLCVFEYIYFSRPDSVLESFSVHEYRRRAGARLAAEHPADADLVLGVPDSGIDAALGFAEASGIPYGIGLVRNRYIGRTFISPGQEQREGLVRLKLNALSAAITGKRIVMIDDSIVRGTTSERIVRLLREAGAAEVHVRISSPPFLNPCYYGTDVPSREHLIAVMHPLEDICRMIGADSLGFLSVDGALSLVDGRAPETFCAACFNGEYPGTTSQRNRL